MPEAIRRPIHRRHRPSTPGLNGLKHLRACVRHGASAIGSISDGPFSHLSKGVSPGPHGAMGHHHPDSHTLRVVGSRRGRERNPTTRR